MKPNQKIIVEGTLINKPEDNEIPYIVAGNEMYSIWIYPMGVRGWKTDIKSGTKVKLIIEEEK